ncbi:MAG TPA: 1-phosphofructokinase family hexose kinase [Deltaproteobacteria bacterium]|jgi:6-phosphofructokinase 2|nr:1-phosphofructokinase family hexose kinase [Deltaproteobacteria bacterium]HQI00232.1 1-phosphofructokinase family hexose kinase [Deltaproteobacteria bacterium]
MGGIVTLTMNPSIDTSCRIPQVVAEQKLRCSSPRHEPGGGGINVSRAIKNLGGDSLALFPSGKIFGDLLTTLLGQEGVSCRKTDILGETREDFIVLEETSGNQFRFGMPGPTMQEDEWQSLLGLLDTLGSQPEYIIGSGSLPPGVPAHFYALLAKKASRLNAKLIVDTSGEALRHAVQLSIFMIKPNRRELCMLRGRDGRKENDIEEMAKAIVNEGKCENIVVSLGAAGALLVRKDRSMYVRAPSVSVVSKVGAGDSMVAGIALSLSRGCGIEEAVKYGVAAGTSAVMSPGSELCRKGDTEELYKKIRAGG